MPKILRVSISYHIYLPRQHSETSLLAIGTLEAVLVGRKIADESVLRSNCNLPNKACLSTCLS